MKILRLAPSTLVVFLSGTSSLWAQGQPIPCDTVPAPVRAAFEKGFAKATINGCSKEVDKGKTIYEFESTEGETRRDVLFNANGSFIGVDETIAVGAAPEPVQQAVRKKFPDGEITISKKRVRGATVQYEFRIKRRNRFVEIVFDGRGNEVKD